jgi:thioredoxin 1
MKRRDIVKAGVALGVGLTVGTSVLAKAYPWEGKEPFPVKGKVTVAEFGASWCAGCPEMEKIFYKVRDYYGDRVAMVYVDIDKYAGIEEKYLVERMPSQRFFDVHGEPIWHHNGALTEDELKERIEILLKAAEDEKTGKKG